MQRILFFVLIAVAAYVAWAWLKRSSSRDLRGPGARPGTDTPQAMVGCAHCGLHLPRHEALPAGERFYCCEEHRQRGPAA